MGKEDKYKAIVIGTSAGGLYAMMKIVESLPVDFPMPLIVVQHRSHEQNYLLEEILQGKTKLRVKQADEKERIQPGTVYFAPPDYHLLIEANGTFSLTSDEEVNYSRPSINVLFESAAHVYGDGLISIVLTGANHDGAEGTVLVKENGGITIAQDPREALFSVMPSGAIATGRVDHVKKLSEIVDFLNGLKNKK